MIARELDPATGAIRLILTPNSSLTRQQARWLLAAMAVAMGTIALFFTAIGAWMVLPFSGGEWLMLALALGWVQRKLAVREIITIHERLVSVDVERLASEQSHRFEKTWLRVERVAPRRRGYPSRLYLRRQRASLEIGSFLIESEREMLAHELRQFL
jgi:uncharacterized membrane protein